MSRNKGVAHLVIDSYLLIINKLSSYLSVHKCQINVDLTRSQCFLKERNVKRSIITI